MSLARNNREMYFSLAAVEEFDLKHGKFMHFDNDNNHWTFYISDDSDGFPLFTAKDGAIRISNKALVRLFRKTTAYTGSETIRFMLRKTNGKVGNRPIVEIVTTKPYHEFVK
jgi:hypothetical protein